MAHGYGGSGAYNLEEFIETIDTWALTDVLLPFLLIFTIVYAVLYKSNILGEKKKNLSMVVALVMALTVVVLHVTGSYPQDYDVVDIMNAAIPNVMLIMMAGFALLLLVGIFGGGPRTKELSFFFTLSVLYLYIVIFINSVFTEASIWIPIVSILIIVVYVIKRKNTTKESGTVIAGGVSVISFSFVLYYFGHEAGWFEEVPWWLQSEEAVYFILVLAAITGVIAYVLRSDDNYSSTNESGYNR